MLSALRGLTAGGGSEIPVECAPPNCFSMIEYSQPGQGGEDIAYYYFRDEAGASIDNGTVFLNAAGNPTTIPYLGDILTDRVAEYKGSNIPCLLNSDDYATVISNASYTNIPHSLSWAEVSTASESGGVSGVSRPRYSGPVTAEYEVSAWLDFSATTIADFRMEGDTLALWNTAGTSQTQFGTREGVRFHFATGNIEKTNGTLIEAASPLVTQDKMTGWWTYKMSLVATVYANDDLRDAVFWTVEDTWTGPNGQEVVLTKTGNSYAGVDIANALKDYPLSSSPGFRVRDISYSANNFVAIGASKKGSATVEDYLAMRNHYTEVDYPVRTALFF